MVVCALSLASLAAPVRDRDLDAWQRAADALANRDLLSAVVTLEALAKAGGALAPEAALALGITCSRWELYEPCPVGPGAFEQLATLAGQQPRGPLRQHALAWLATVALGSPELVPPEERLREAAARFGLSDLPALWAEARGEHTEALGYHRVLLDHEVEPSARSAVSAAALLRDARQHRGLLATDPDPARETLRGEIVAWMEHVWRGDATLARVELDPELLVWAARWERARGREGAAIRWARLLLARGVAGPETDTARVLLAELGAAEGPEPTDDEMRLCCASARPEPPLLVAIGGRPRAPRVVPLVLAEELEPCGTLAPFLAAHRGELGDCLAQAMKRGTAVEGELSFGYEGTSAADDPVLAACLERIAHRGLDVGGWSMVIDASAGKQGNHRRRAVSEGDGGHD